MSISACMCDSCSVVFDSFQLHGLQSARFICPWNYPGKNTGAVAIFYSGDLPDPAIGPKDQTIVFCVSCIGRRILYDWVNWEATISTYLLIIILNINVLNSPIKRPKWLNMLKTTTTYKSFYFFSTSKLVQFETKGSQTDNEGKKKDTMQMKMKR